MHYACTPCKLDGLRPAELSVSCRENTEFAGSVCFQPWIRRSCHKAHFLRYTGAALCCLEFRWRLHAGRYMKDIVPDFDIGSRVASGRKSDIAAKQIFKRLLSELR